MTSHNVTAAAVARLEELVRAVYADRAGDVPFHGWPHIAFVRAKAVEFAPGLGADPLLVEAAALVHDLNYLAEPGTEPPAGQAARDDVLARAGVGDADRAAIERIVNDAHTADRGPDLSPEAMALSDADTLFKALPVTPVALSCLFRSENGLSVAELAHKIVREQLPLLNDGIYFYSAETEAKYGAWATVNVTLWAHVLDALDDPDVVRLLGDMGLE